MSPPLVNVCQIFFTTFCDAIWAFKLFPLTHKPNIIKYPSLHYWTPNGKITRKTTAIGQQKQGDAPPGGSRPSQTTAKRRSLLPAGQRENHHGQSPHQVRVDRRDSR